MQKQSQSLVITSNGQFVGFLNLSKSVDVRAIDLNKITDYFNNNQSFEIEHPKEKATVVAPWE